MGFSLGSFWMSFYGEGFWVSQALGRGEIREDSFGEILSSHQRGPLEKVVSFQNADRLLKKKCELEVSLLYPPVSCLKRIDQMRVHYQKDQLAFAKRAEYEKLCVSRAPQMKDLRWIQRAIDQKPRHLCEKALIRQKEILKYRGFD